MAEFGAGEIRAAARGKSIGPVRITVSPALKPESFRILRSAGGHEVRGGDPRGAMYGALDLAEQVQLTGAVQEKQVEPSLPMRALKFNIPMPGTGYLSEEDMARGEWFWDLGYWRGFLDMAARNRYNALTFWSAHPFDRMARIAKYPEANAIPAAELDRNIAFFRKLFQMAAERGLDTYLVTWNIHVPRSFAAHHSIPAGGFDSPLVRDYQREAIQALFDTYPTLTGLGTTIGERMSALTMTQRLDWIADTYLAALRRVGRPVPFILRYWQSEPEAMAAMLDRVRYPGPVYLDIKFNGEHMYSSPKPHVLDPKWVERARGRYRLLWHLRNDDVFILRWGDPDFVRETVRNIAGPDSAGFIEGSELDVPGPDRNHTASAKTHLDWAFKFEKHWFRYMLWGRLGYRHSEPDQTWRAHFTHRFGAAGGDAFESVRQAGKIAPIITSYHWNYMNGDWYPEGSIGSWNTSYEQPRVNYRRAAMYHDIRTYIFNNTLDPEMANIPEHLAGSKAVGPLEIAARLEAAGKGSLAALARARARVERGRKEFECTERDMLAYGQLGIYYAEKLRGATRLGRFLFFGGEAERRGAVEHLERSAAAWRAVVAATRDHYIPHEVWLFGEFDWARYQPDVERDIRIAREARPFRTGSTYDVEGLRPWLVYANGLLKRPSGAPAEAKAAPVAVEAESAYSLTPAMRVADDPSASGGKFVTLTSVEAKREAESITGFRDFVSPANSAAYRIQVPADGTYQLSVSCWWPEKSGAVVVLVDEGNTQSYTLRPPSGSPPRTWNSQTVNARLELGAGVHTVRFFGRSAGVRIDRFLLAPAGPR